MWHISDIVENLFKSDLTLWLGQLIHWEIFNWKKRVFKRLFLFAKPFSRVKDWVMKRKPSNLLGFTRLTRLLLFLHRYRLTCLLLFSQARNATPPPPATPHFLNIFCSKFMGFFGDYDNFLKFWIWATPSFLKMFFFLNLDFLGIMTIFLKIWNKI